MDQPSNIDQAALEEYGYSVDEIEELRCGECNISWTPEQSKCCPSCGTNGVYAKIKKKTIRHDPSASLKEDNEEND